MPYYEILGARTLQAAFHVSLLQSKQDIAGEVLSCILLEIRAVGAMTAILAVASKVMGKSQKQQEHQGCKAAAERLEHWRDLD